MYLDIFFIELGTTSPAYSATLGAMAKHDFLIGLMDQHNNVCGARCRNCEEIVLYVNGSIPPEKLSEECPRENVGKSTTQS